jgi:two-component system, OmpR family, response regulator
MRIVVLTPDRGRGERLTALLARHAVELAADRAALERALARPCALVVVDRANDGVETCRQLRLARPGLALLLMTSEGDVAERVRGLEAGADDCLAEPFAESQLVARVDALGRRVERAPRDAELIDADGCRLDLGRGLAERSGERQALSAREIGLLRWLHRHRERAVSRAELLEQVWGVAPDLETRAVDVAVATLRRKIERDPSRPRIVVSVKGVGYAWGEFYKDLT